MKIKGELLMSLGLMAITGGIVITALQWPLKTALFPVAIGIPVFFMALSLFLLDLFGKEKEAGNSRAVDFRLSESKDQKLTNRRTVSIFLWILGFFLLILLIGFPLGIPVFFVAFLRFRSKESWRLTIILSACAWIFFYGLFIWTLHIPFAEGWVMDALRALGVMSR